MRDITPAARTQAVELADLRSSWRRLQRSQSAGVGPDGMSCPHYGHKGAVACRICQPIDAGDHAPLWSTGYTQHCERGAACPETTHALKKTIKGWSPFEGGRLTTTIIFLPAAARRRVVPHVPALRALLRILRSFRRARSLRSRRSSPRTVSPFLSLASLPASTSTTQSSGTLPAARSRARASPL